MNIYHHISAFWGDYAPVVWMTIVTWVGMRIVFWLEDRVRERRYRAAGPGIRQRLTVLQAQRHRAQRILARINAEEARLR